MREQTTVETRDERAQRLLHLGLQVAATIREEPADAVARLLVGLDYAELRDMVMMLAAATPVQMPPSALLGWWTNPRPQLQPCGSIAAARRHQRRGEELDPLCEQAAKEWDRVRQAKRRAQQRQEAA